MHWPVQDASAHPHAQDASRLVVPQEHTAHSQTPEVEHEQLSPEPQAQPLSWQAAPQRHGSQLQPPSASQAQASLAPHAQLSQSQVVSMADAAQVQSVQLHCAPQQQMFSLAASMSS
jgi:hypothetical protein